MDIQLTKIFNHTVKSWEFGACYTEMHLKKKKKIPPATYLHQYMQKDLSEKSLLVTSDHRRRRKQDFLLKVFDSFGADKSPRKHRASDNYLATIAIKIK